MSALQAPSGADLVDWGQSVTGVVPARGLYLSTGKVALDTLLILLTSFLWIPLYGFLAAVNLLLEGRPIHYRGTRLGRDGREFSVLKFRTMTQGAEANLQAILAASAEQDDEFSQYQKMQRDPRVTRFGGKLRRLSLDELPQLWNVLRGQMSLVGPRPVTKSEWLDNYGDAAPQVFSVRPGMTGLWQVSGRSLLSYPERVALDLQYVDRCGLRTDLKILFRSISAVARGRGAF